MTTVVTSRVDEEMLGGLDRLAQHLDRSRAWLIAEAIRRYVADETTFLDFLQEGADDFARGDYISHDEFIAELKVRRQTKAA